MRAAVLVFLSACAFAQTPDLVKWSFAAQPSTAPPGATVLVRADARIEPGWHLYSASSPAGIPATFELAPNAVADGLRVFQPPPVRAFDANFGSDTETYQGEAVFLLEVRLKKDAPHGPASLPLSLRYQTCSDTQCVPARRSETVALTIDPAAAAITPALPSGYQIGQAPRPVQPRSSQAFTPFLLVAFGFGLASIFTPCVFPMIPITMSYFLNRESGGRRDSVLQATVFCLGIVVLFSGLGLAATAILGPVGVKQLGSNPWVNGFIAALFIAFGLSLLGAFEITVPSSVLTRLNSSSGKGGFTGTLLMGLTFSLASFACVGPFVGTLLAASVSGGGARPLAGMVAFAAGLALPFFLLALFPSWLKRLPRSGGWMARVKVVMGFVILAASLKYLASVDQVAQWGFLTRERFLAAWIVLFAMAGLYLLGFVRLEGIKPDEPMGLGRLLVGIAFLVFAISLLPGMFGGKLGELDAYVPAADAGAVAPGGGQASPDGLVWMKDRYRQALGRARAENKLVFVDFTGYACTNCHWMRANMLSRPEIASVLKNFVLVELYTDGTDAASEQNSKLQLAKFNTVAEPFYAILDPEENVVAKFAGLTKDPHVFLAFLNQAAGAQGPGTGARGPGAGGQGPGAGAQGPGAGGQGPGTGGQGPAAEAQGPGTGGQGPGTRAQGPGAGGQGLVAAELPRFTGLDGAPIDTSALAGKVVVVNFWATWCVPCIQEIPGFNKLHRDFGPQGVVVLGVSMDDEGAARVGPFLKKHPMEYTVALGSADISQKYGLDELPVTLVFDRAGNQVQRFVGFTPEAALQAAVRQAL